MVGEHPIARFFAIVYTLIHVQIKNSKRGFLLVLVPSRSKGNGDEEFTL